MVKFTISKRLKLLEQPVIDRTPLVVMAPTSTMYTHFKFMDLYLKCHVNHNKGSIQMNELTKISIL